MVSEERRIGEEMKAIFFAELDKVKRFVDQLYELEKTLRSVENKDLRSALACTVVFHITLAGAGSVDEAVGMLEKVKLDILMAEMYKTGEAFMKALKRGDIQEILEAALSEEGDAGDS